MSFRMLQPWVNPRSEFYWFRRRVPKAYRMFGMPAEIKFSLGTKDWDEAVLRCQEENLRLEREWRGRRWHSAEPCHPFLAVAQGKIANPLVLIDEIEKAATRADYGRLWDCLLAFLEPETGSRYLDPALQTNLDLSQISYIATANRLDPLPWPIRDRFRIVTFPKPMAEHLDALLPAVLADLARERGLDRSWLSPLTGMEYAAVGQLWRGGSVRRLRRIIEAVLHEREARALRN